MKIVVCFLNSNISLCLGSMFVSFSSMDNSFVCFYWFPVADEGTLGECCVFIYSQMICKERFGGMKRESSSLKIKRLEWKTSYYNCYFIIIFFCFSLLYFFLLF